jgi:hypothetical protein
MKATIEVKDRKEVEHIRAALDDPATRAFVVVMGALSLLPSNRARRRVLTFVADYFAEHDEISRQAMHKEVNELMAAGAADAERERAEKRS